MRCIFSFLAVLLLPMVMTGQDQQLPEHEAKELAAIMEVIKTETKCFYERNYDCWKTQWTNENYASHAWNNSDGTYYTKIGFEGIDQAAAAFIKKYPLGKDKSSHPIVKREDMVVHFLGDTGAYLTWKQYNSNREQTKFTISRDFRIMEKMEGQWKIVSVSSFWDYKNLVDNKDGE